MKLNFKFLAKSPDFNVSVESPVEQWSVPAALESSLKTVVQQLDHLDALPDNGAVDLVQKIVVPIKVKWLFLSFNRKVEIDVTAQISLN